MTAIPADEPRYYRVDKFAVPARSRREFVERVRVTHDLLKTMPGFIGDMVLEHASGPGEFNFVTIVEWRNQGAIQRARQAVGTAQRAAGFDPYEMFERLNIKADIATYTALAPEFA